MPAECGRVLRPNDGCRAAPALLLEPVRTMADGGLPARTPPYIVSGCESYGCAQPRQTTQHSSGRHCALAAKRHSALPPPTDELARGVVKSWNTAAQHATPLGPEAPDFTRLEKNETRRRVTARARAMDHVIMSEYMYAARTRT